MDATVTDTINRTILELKRNKNLRLQNSLDYQSHHTGIETRHD